MNNFYSTEIGKSECTFQFFIGPRGAGKVYAASREDGIGALPVGEQALRSRGEHEE